jgi:hypothetical protein
MDPLKEFSDRLEQNYWRNVAAGGPVLAVASSNTATDQLMEACARTGLRVVRIGDSVRIRPEMRQYSLEQVAAKHPAMKEVRAPHAA